MEVKPIKLKFEIENKEEIEQWISSLISKLEKANSLADELAKPKKCIKYNVQGIKVK